MKANQTLEPMTRSAVTFLFQRGVSGALHVMTQLVVRREPACMDKLENRTRVLLDIVVFGIAMALLGVTLRFGPEVGHPVRRGSAAMIGGVYILYLGALFLFSYFFPRGASFSGSLITSAATTLTLVVERWRGFTSGWV